MVLACATFPLVWVGGLVTTTDAGMAVPDWPNTYGYNLFLYPWQTWLAGPWDLFVEHGHRLLAPAVGMLTIGSGRRAVAMRARGAGCAGLGLAALALVIFQGVLGGMRVLLDERTLAMLHGCTGPLFFALTVAMVVFTSQRWRSAMPPTGSRARRPRFARWLAVARASWSTCNWCSARCCGTCRSTAEPTTFALAVRFHLFLAAVLSLHVAAAGVARAAPCSHVRPLAGLA